MEIEGGRGGGEEKGWGRGGRRWEAERRGEEREVNKRERGYEWEGGIHGDGKGEYVGYGEVQGNKEEEAGHEGEEEFKGRWMGR